MNIFCLTGTSKFVTLKTCLGSVINCSQTSVAQSKEQAWLTPKPLLYLFIYFNKGLSDSLLVWLLTRI